MIMKETGRTNEKKEKQNKKQKQNIKRINERKNIELDSPKVASEMPWRCPLLSFFGGCCSKIVRYRMASVPKWGPWWFPGAFCFAMRAPGALLSQNHVFLGSVVGGPPS